MSRFKVGERVAASPVNRPAAARPAADGWEEF